MLSLRTARLKGSSAANVAVEFALVTALFAVPLLLGAADFVSIMAAKAQLNTALEALYAYSLTTRGASATDATAILDNISSNSTFKLKLNAVTITYKCYTTADSTPSFTASGTSACGTGKTTMTFANYEISTTIALPVPLPFFSNPLTLSSSGSVQVATANDVTS